MLGMGIEEIRRLSQDEGYKDLEIANMLGVHRVTVTRVRNSHNIPKANLRNRKDKVTYCNRCGTRFIIRRRERTRLCPQCECHN